MPDAPINVAEAISSRTVSTLGLSWSAGASNGGTAVIDYRVSASTGGAYSILVSGLKVLSYTATSLTAGTTYTFVV